MIRPCIPTRRGFTLIEAIAAIIILALTAPVTLSVLSDAAASRIDALNTTRATWYAGAVIEHILADVSSGSPGLGFDALADADHYLNDPGAGLEARLGKLVAPYADLGMSHEVVIGAPVAADGVATGDADLDLYRYVTVTIHWTSARHGAKALDVGVLVGEVAP